jgi:hypothetical protein
VLGGAPVFKGTRIPVLDIADMLANGDSPARIIRAYPQRWMPRKPNSRLSISKLTRAEAARVRRPPRAHGG